jgi:hypothetical protein
MSIDEGDKRLSSHKTSHNLKGLKGQNLEREDLRQLALQGTEIVLLIREQALAAEKEH